MKLAQYLDTKSMPWKKSRIFRYQTLAVLFYFQAAEFFFRNTLEMRDTAQMINEADLSSCIDAA